MATTAETPVYRSWREMKAPTSYKLQVASYEFQITSFTLQVTSFALDVTSYKLQAGER